MRFKSDKEVLAVLPTSTGGKVRVTSARIEVPQGWEQGDRASEPELIAEGRIPGRPHLVPLGFMRLTAGSAAGAVMVKPLESIPIWHELTEVAPLALVIASSTVVADDSGNDVDAVTSAGAKEAIMSRFLPGWAAEFAPPEIPERGVPDPIRRDSSAE